MPNNKNAAYYFLTFLFFCSANHLSSMEPAQEQQLLCSPIVMAALCCVGQRTFKNCTVLDADGCEIVAKEIALKALLVHSNNTYRIPQENAKIPNLIFTEPKENTYDCITLFDHNSTQKPKLIKNLHRNKKYLKHQGILLTFVQTKENIFCPETQAFVTLYPEIFQASRSEKVKEKYHPLDIDFKNAFYGEEELKEKIDKIGYTIESYGNSIYDIIIKDEPLYLKYLKETSFPKFTQEFNLSDEASLELAEKFAHLITSTLPRNKDGYLIHKIDTTEFELIKKIQPK